MLSILVVTRHSLLVSRGLNNCKPLQQPYLFSFTHVIVVFVGLQAQIYVERVTGWRLVYTFTSLLIHYGEVRIIDFGWKVDLLLTSQLSTGSGTLVRY
jgi:hypothetical protein